MNSSMVKHDASKDEVGQIFPASFTYQDDDPSPLGPLDPSRLREMVVDQQAFNHGQPTMQNNIVQQQMHWQQSQAMQNNQVDQSMIQAGTPVSLTLFANSFRYPSSEHSPHDPQLPQQAQQHFDLNQQQIFVSQSQSQPQQVTQAQLRTPICSTPQTPAAVPSPGGPMFQQQMVPRQGVPIHPQVFPNYNVQPGQWPQQAPPAQYPGGPPRMPPQMPQRPPIIQPQIHHRMPFSAPGYHSQQAAFQRNPMVRPAPYPANAMPTHFAYPNQPPQYPPAQPLQPGYTRGPQNQSIRFINQIPGREVQMHPGYRTFPPIPSQYVVREAHLNIPPDMLFVGCYFLLIDSDKYAPDRNDLNQLIATIRMLGGDLDQGTKAINDRFNVATHIIVDSLSTLGFPQQPGQMSMYNQALTCRKRLVTLQWLTDALTQRRLDVPWRAAHLPTVYGEGRKPHNGKLFVTAGFEGSEYQCVSFMVEAIGGLFREKHPKIDKAREWQIPVVNFSWLQDVYFGKQANVDQAPYSISVKGADVDTTAYSLELISDVVRHVLLPWRWPIIFDASCYNRSAVLKYEAENDPSLFPNKKISFKKGCAGKQPRVAFAGLDDDICLVLAQMVEALGGVSVLDIANCSHLVLPNAKRSYALLKGIAYGVNVVKAEFILTSFSSGGWVDTLSFFVKDEESERQYGFNLKHSVLLARKRCIFQNFCFYVTPSISTVKEIQDLLASSGANLQSNIPTRGDVAEQLAMGKPYVIIAAEADCHMISDLINCSIPVFCPEWVMLCILRQQIMIVNELRVCWPKPQAPPTPIPQQSSFNRPTCPTPRVSR